MHLLIVHPLQERNALPSWEKDGDDKLLLRTNSEKDLWICKFSRQVTSQESHGTSFNFCFYYKKRQYLTVCCVVRKGHGKLGVTLLTCALQWVAIRQQVIVQLVKILTSRQTHQDHIALSQDYTAETACFVHSKPCSSITINQGPNAPKEG